MKKVIYISNNKITYIKSSLKGDIFTIQDLKEVDLVEGSFMNGSIVNRDTFKESLLKLKELVGKDIQKSELFIDSKSINIKKVDIPNKMNKEMIQGLPKMEFSHISEMYTDLTYSVEILKEDKEKKALCCAVEEKLIQSFFDVFEDSEISLKSIDIVLMGYLNFGLFSKVGNLSDTFLLNIIEDNVLYSIIFSNQKFIFYTRNRFFDSVNSSAFVKTQQEIISSMCSFQLSLNSENPLYKVYYYGLEDDSFEYLKESLGKSDVEIEKLNINVTYNEKVEDLYKNKIIPLYAVAPRKIGYNLLNACNVNLDFDALQKQRKMMIVVPCICLLIISILSGINGLKLKSAMDTKKELETILNSEEYMTAYIKGVQVTEILGNLSNKFSSLSETDNSVSEGNLDVQFLEFVKSKELDNIDTKSITYDRLKGSISFVINTTTEKGASEFVGILRNSGKFKDIKYELRSLANSTTYNFEVTVYPNPLFDMSLYISEEGSDNIE